MSSMPSRLTEHLISRGLLFAEQAASALETHRRNGGALDTRLLESSSLTESELLRAVAAVSGQRAIDLWDLEVNHHLASVIPFKIASRFGLVPLSVEGDALHVACSYPVPVRELHEIGFLLKKRLELWVGLEVRIRDWMQTLYGEPLHEHLASLLSRLNSRRGEPQQETMSAAVAEVSPQKESRPLDLIDRLARAIVDEPLPLVDWIGAPPALKNGESAREEIPDWTLAQARDALKQATSDRDQIIDVTLRFARRAFEFTAIFAVIRGAAVLWEARAERHFPQRPQRPEIPIDVHSVFRTVCNLRKSYIGPLPSDPLTREFLARLGRSPRTIFLFPVEVSGRTVAIVYGDCAHRPMSHRRLSDFVLFCQDLSAEFEALLLDRRRPHGKPGHLAEVRRDEGHQTIRRWELRLAEPPPGPPVDL
ncbi:MAG TPA: hypothetical protein VEM39_11145 [Myxococcaceae bacterium]|nr:hypothetical protein [Myxococcaceae bacterium]